MTLNDAGSLIWITALLLLFCGIVGFPLTNFIVNRAFSNSRDGAIFRLSFAPIAGLMLLVWVSVISITVHFDPGLASWGLFALSAGMTIRLILRAKVGTGGTRAGALVLALTALMIILNCKDLFGVRARDYFPRTNDDTFSYLGQIDQFRTMKGNSPQLIYPAGYHAYFRPGERDASTAWVAALANAFRLESHIALFSALRLLLMLMAFALLSLLLALGVSQWISAGALFFFVVGNYGFHSVLQQFLSASLGIVVTMGAATLAVLSVGTRAECKDLFAAAFAAGLLFLSSPEAFPFLGLTLLVVFLMESIRRMLRSKQAIPPALIVVALAGFLSATYPLLRGNISLILERMNYVPGPPPPPLSVQAVAAHLLHLMGLTSGLGWRGVRTMEYGILVIFPTLYAASALFLLIRLRKANRFESQQEDSSLIYAGFAVLGLVCLAFQFFFAAQGNYYAWVKVMDYYCFLPCLLPVLLLQTITNTGASAGRNRIVLLSFFLLVLVFAAPWFSSKRQILNFYRDNIRQSPPLALYHLPKDSDPSIGAIRPMQKKFHLELVYYLNRWGNVPLEVITAAKSEFGSRRFVPGYKPPERSTHSFCLPPPWNSLEIQDRCEAIFKRLSAFSSE